MVCTHGSHIAETYVVTPWRVHAETDEHFILAVPTVVTLVQLFRPAAYVQPA